MLHKHVHILKFKLKNLGWNGLSSFLILLDDYEIEYELFEILNAHV